MCHLYTPFAMAVGHCLGAEFYLLKCVGVCEVELGGTGILLRILLSDFNIPTQLIMVVTT